MKKYKFPSESLLKELEEDILKQREKMKEEDIHFKDEKYRPSLQELSSHFAIKNKLTYQDLKNKLIEGEIYSRGNFLMLDKSTPIPTTQSNYSNILGYINYMEGLEEEKDKPSLTNIIVGGDIWVQTEEGWCNLNLVEVVETDN